MMYSKVRGNGDPNPSPSPDTNFSWESWHGGPYFEVKFSDLSIDTERGHKTGCHYLLHFTAVHIIASQNATSVLACSPQTTSGTKKTSTSEPKPQFTGGLQMGVQPNVGLTASYSGGPSTEEVRNGLEIIVTRKVRGSPAGERIMRWAYGVDDDTEKRMGLTILPAPHVKLGFEGMIPHLEVEVLTLWSTHTCPSGQQPRPTWWPPSKNKKSIPSFTNFLQQSTISVPLEDLKGGCRTSDSVVHAKTEAPLPDSHVQAQRSHEEQVKRKNNVVDLKVNFGCALYDETNSTDSEIKGVLQKCLIRTIKADPICRSTTTKTSVEIAVE
jgi:hypothetical protein